MTTLSTAFHNKDPLFKYEFASEIEVFVYRNRLIPIGFNDSMESKFSVFLVLNFFKTSWLVEGVHGIIN